MNPFEAEALLIELVRSNERQTAILQEVKTLLRDVLARLPPVQTYHASVGGTISVK
jgi:hypothetical protein